MHPGRRKRPADFQLFPDSQRLLRTYDFQFPKASGGAAGHGNKVDYLPVVYAGAFQYEGGEFVLSIFYFPTVEIGGFLVVIVENL